jgi:hypothetical protein
LFVALQKYELGGIVVAGLQGWKNPYFADAIIFFFILPKPK